MPALTRDMIYAAAWDAGDRSMRAADRTTRSVEDFNAASREYDRLNPWRGEFDEDFAKTHRARCPRCQEYGAANIGIEHSPR